MESERLDFESTLAKFGEHVTFPEQILFAGASFRDGSHAPALLPAIQSNVRMCDFFVQIFGESWPGPVFQGLVQLALSCTEDASMAMRRPAVFFRNSDQADEQVRQFRDSLAAGGKCDLREFRDSAELEIRLREIYAVWHASVKQRP
jgi:hypothetical protein